MNFKSQTIVLLLIYVLLGVSIGFTNCLPVTSSSPSSGRNLKDTKDFITVALDSSSPDSAYFGPNSWISYDIFEQQFILESPWDSARLKYTEAPSSESIQRYLLIYDKQTLENSMDVASEMAGSIYGFAVNGAVEYAKNTQTSSESTSVSVMMRTDIKSLTLPLSASELVPLLKDEAHKMAQEKPQEFFKKYGTHFISLQQYACYAELKGSYTFKSSEQNEEFKSSVEADYKGGVFTASASASIGKKAKAVSEKASFSAVLRGDTFEIAPQDPSKLESWSDALVKGFSKQCIERKDSTHVRQIQIRSWSSVFNEIPGTAELNSGSIAILQKASLLKKITYEGYQNMASFFVNHQMARKGQKQWTGSLGHVCEWNRDGPYTMKGPQGNTSDDLMKAAEKLNVQGWAFKNETVHGQTPASAVMNYFEKMANAYAEYVKLANEFIPSVHVTFRGMKPWSTVVGNTVDQRYVLDMFNEPIHVEDGYVNVCLKQFAREQAIIDGCKPNVTYNSEIPVAEGIVLSPIVSIPMGKHPQASTSIKVTKPNHMENEGFPYKPQVIDCPLVDQLLDDAHRYSKDCTAETKWCTEGYAGALCSRNDYAFPNMYIAYEILGDTDRDYKEYGYPGYICIFSSLVNLCSLLPPLESPSALLTKFHPSTRLYGTYVASLKAAQTNPSKAPNLGLGCQSELVGTISGDAILAPKSGTDLVEADSGNPTFYDGRRLRGYAPRAKFPKSASQETSVIYDISKDNSVGCVEDLRLCTVCGVVKALCQCPLTQVKFKLRHLEVDRPFQDGRGRPCTINPPETMQCRNGISRYP
eukprot:Nk52_evm1s317 gene=Nk52_evmTU1s317